MSSSQVFLITLLSIFVSCQSFPRPWGAPPGGVPKLALENNRSSLCRVICSRKDVVCPPECAFTDLDIFNKRSYRVNRGRAFGDIRAEDNTGLHSFDDYLFMKLLGRNLGDRD